MSESTNLNNVLSSKAKFIFITGGVVSSLGKGLWPRSCSPAVLRSGCATSTRTSMSTPEL